jgi:hypothetical protein
MKITPEKSFVGFFDVEKQQLAVGNNLKSLARNQNFCFIFFIGTG